LKFRCTVCNYVYDEEKEGKSFASLPADWKCPVCGSPKSVFVPLEEEEKAAVKETTVSDVLVEQLEAWGIRFFFGIPGTSTLGIHDAIRKRPHLTYVQVRHEEVAAFMASAYGKLTGNPAVCIGVSGPGATNLVTGLADAHLDRSPVIALTGLVPRKVKGTGAEQEIDQYSLFAPITVYNELLSDVRQTLELCTQAVKRAILSRGVAHLGVPNDVQKLPYEAKPRSFQGSVANVAYLQSPRLIMEAARVINVSERPVIIAGWGAMGKGPMVLNLAKKISAPVTTTFRGKSLLDGSEPLYVGCHGSLGTTAATELVRKSDLLIVIGSSFSNLTMIPQKRTVQVDIDPLVIGRRYPVEVGLVGNSSEVVPALTDAVDTKRRDEYLEEVANLKNAWGDLLAAEYDEKSKPLRPPYIMRVLSEEVSADAVISVDTGENLWWFGRNFSMRSTQTHVMSGILGSMGFGLPGAMAASLAYPGRQAVCIAGDGGFSMVMADMLTCTKYGLPVKVFVLSNGQLGMIMQEQKTEGYPNWATDLRGINFAEYASLCGAIGIRVEEPGDLRGAVRKALDSKGPALVDIITDPKRF
jgi:pyruvate oxidase